MYLGRVGIVEDSINFCHYVLPEHGGIFFTSTNNLVRMTRINDFIL